MRPVRSVNSLGSRAGLTLLLLAAACGGKSSDGTDDVSPSTGEVAVRIDSHFLSDVNIWISRGSGGSWTRLGLAGANSTTSFVVQLQRMGNSGPAHLKADPIGGARQFISEGVSIRPGSMIVWTLESSLNRSQIAVY